MKFDMVVFWIAGIWGVLVLTPLYFMFDVIGAAGSCGDYASRLLLRIHQRRVGVAACILGHRAGSGALPADDDSFRAREIRVWRFPDSALFAASAASVGPGVWRSRCVVWSAVLIGILQSVEKKS